MSNQLLFQANLYQYVFDFFDRDQVFQLAASRHCSLDHPNEFSLLDDIASWNVHMPLIESSLMSLSFSMPFWMSFSIAFCEMVVVGAFFLRGEGGFSGWVPHG